MSKGKRIKKEKAEKAKLAEFEQNKLSETQQDQAPKYNAFTNPKNVNWVILSGAMATLIIVLLFVPQQLGAGITSVYSVMLWTGLFGATLFRYIGRSGWYGFFTGSIVGMFLHIFAPLLQSLFT
ncbi:hypothetical protein PN836_012610 [Ningiella sp. W23]|uniref:hypothetical protein n=1 Tax=Ningiella sp. W23 TaxID=3023715 RepID=UPI003757EFB0